MTLCLHYYLSLDVQLGPVCPRLMKEGWGRDWPVQTFEV